MSDRAFEVEGDKVLVVNDGRVVASPVPEGISPAMFRHILGAADLLYRKLGMLPSVDQVVNTWTKFDRVVVSRVFTAPEFEKALALRGIHIDAKAGLTAEQQYAITILQDPTDARATSTKLKDIGVSMAKYRAWMRDPLFSSLMSSQAEQNLVDAIPTVLNRLVSNAEAGHVGSIDKILEMTGRWNPQQQEVQNAKTVVLIVMEALQKYAPPEVLRSVLDEVQKNTQVLTITQGLKELS